MTAKKQHRGRIFWISFGTMNLVLALALAFVISVITMPAHAGTIKVLYTFSGGADGGTPEGSLIEDAKGNLYGTASVGGDLTCAPPLGCGTVFKLTTANKLIVLHTFVGGTDGASPYAALLMDAAGNLYGTTSAGGEAKGCFGNGCGTVFKIDPTGKESVLYRFKGKTDGGRPYSTLIVDTAGNFYGTTQAGGDLSCGLGSTGCGTVFKMTKAGKETVLYSFKGGTDGAYPGNESLVMDSKGNLYGTASHGGDLSCNPSNGCGTVFVLAKTGTLTVLHTFTGVADGSFPESGVILFNDILYGTAGSGGKYNLGTLYSINLAGDVFTNLHDFKGGTQDGARPYAPPALAPASGATDATTLPPDIYVLLPQGGKFNNGGFMVRNAMGRRIILAVSFDSGVNGNGPLVAPVFDSVLDCFVVPTPQGGPERGGSPYGTVDCIFLP